MQGSQVVETSADHTCATRPSPRGSGGARAAVGLRKSSSESGLAAVEPSWRHDEVRAGQLLTVERHREMVPGQEEARQRRGLQPRAARHDTGGSRGSGDGPSRSEADEPGSGRRRKHRPPGQGPSTSAELTWYSRKHYDPCGGGRKHPASGEQSRTGIRQNGTSSAACTRRGRLSVGRRWAEPTNRQQNLSEG